LGAHILLGIFWWLSNYSVLRKDSSPWRYLVEELHKLHSSPTIIWVVKSREMKWASHITYMGDMRNVDKILVGKPEGKR
jgi:hypothetical protein